LPLRLGPQPFLRLGSFQFLLDEPFDERAFGADDDNEFFNWIGVGSKKRGY
jgi:hypothetical protein